MTLFERDYPKPKKRRKVKCGCTSMWVCSKHQGEA